MKSIIKIFCGVTLIIYWGYLLLSITLINRPHGLESRLELNLFWCVKEAWNFRVVSDWYFIIGNILLFIPLGLILPIFFNKLRVLWKVLLIGFVVSFTVEVAQLILGCGLSELDDLFNNTLGCFLGYCIFMVIRYVFSEKKKKRDLCVAVISWLFVVGFFVVAFYMEQPIVEAVNLTVDEIKNIALVGR